MSYRLNPSVRSTVTPPIAEAAAWVAGRTFAPDRPLLDLAQAVPSYPPAEDLRAHLATVVGRERTSVYTDILGRPALRRALADHLGAAYGATVAPERVAITAGCNQAFCLAVSALAGPGDEIVLPVPYYFNHQMWIEMQGVRPVYLPIGPAAGGVPDPERAAALITGRTRAIVLVTPNNPTGAEYPPAVIESFFALAQDRGLALVMDETYKDFRGGDGPPHALFQREGWADTLVHLYSFSKAYSLTGYRVGAVTCGPALMDQIAKLMDCVAICAPRIGQEAALYGLTHLADWVAGKRRLMGERAAALRAAFTRNELAYELVTAGAYFAYVRHPFAGTSAAAVARRLADAHDVLCLPGGMFGPDQDAYLRFAFANLDAGAMPELVQRMVASQG